MKLAPTWPLILLAVVSLTACSDAPKPSQNAGSGTTHFPASTPKAQCGPGSMPETGMQGRVSKEDVASGRAAQGYTCNTQLIGHHGSTSPNGTQGGFKVLRYVDKDGHECAYYDSTLAFPTNWLNLPDINSGVIVLDMTDPSNPIATERLQTLAMLSPHESLNISKDGLLVGVLGNAGTAPGLLDVYDVSADCRHPELKSSLPVGVFGHEGGISADGKTFYSASPFSSTLVPIDLSNPSLPVPLGFISVGSHGLSVSPDGNRVYIASTTGLNTNPYPGLIILDSSDFQARKPNPQFREISRITWDEVSVPQNTIPITIKGKPYLIEIDEYTSNFSKFDGKGTVGAGRIIDISDELHPKVISNLRLEVHQPENSAAIQSDPGALNPTGGLCRSLLQRPHSNRPQHRRLQHDYFRATHL